MCPYKENGYKNRGDYLRDLSEWTGVSLDMVHLTASMLGQSEDFDGLVTTLEDYNE